MTNKEYIFIKQLTLEGPNEIIIKKENELSAFDQFAIENKWTLDNIQPCEDCKVHCEPIEGKHTCPECRAKSN